jgi:hypothetical protein
MFQTVKVEDDQAGRRSRLQDFEDNFLIIFDNSFVDVGEKESS